MNTKETLNAIRNIISQHNGDERELLQELDAEAEGWKMRLQELDEELE